jgi:hypothetical protein
VNACDDNETVTDILFKDNRPIISCSGRGIIMAGKEPVTLYAAGIKIADKGR